VDCEFQRETLGGAAFTARYGTFGQCVASLATTQTLWFTETAGNRVAQVTTDGVIFEFMIPTASSRPIGVAEGPMGDVWFAESVGNKIGRLDVQDVGKPAAAGQRADDAASLDAILGG
jgi:streptogramin lyase